MQPPPYCNGMASGISLCSTQATPIGQKGCEQPFTREYSLYRETYESVLLLPGCHGCL